ncbi:flagellar assembly peptidoglycan hydrolase FlgJ [Bermanella sp. R86510]|uniref:flagellar assembly peptidoglycan hydrolase FlgJ n=1 Tax=unclassified Bermanella TaxID=2627862 RepID=UPI0037C90AA3
MNNLSSTYNYNDLSALNKITQLGEESEADALKQVASQFESMFVKMMLKSMRDANAVFEEGNPLNTNESKFYRDMFDDQLALSMTKGKGIGLADSIYRQLKQEFDIKDNSNISNEKGQEEQGIRKYIGPSRNEQSSNATEALDSKPETHTINQPVIEQDNVAKTSLAVDKQKQTAFATPQEFVSTLWPIAQKVGKDMGVEPKAIMAQAALETGWGKHIIHHSGGKNSHNLFGIKADSRWQGESAEVNTLEYRGGIAQTEKAKFRVYESYEQSLRDYSEFVSNSNRYQPALESGQSIKSYSEGLQNGGYATDPFYAKKIQRIAHSETLNQAIELAVNSTPRG